MVRKELREDLGEEQFCRGKSKCRSPEAWMILSYSKHRRSVSKLEQCYNFQLLERWIYSFFSPRNHLILCLKFDLVCSARLEKSLNRIARRELVPFPRNRVSSENKNTTKCWKLQMFESWEECSYLSKCTFLPRVGTMTFPKQKTHWTIMGYCFECINICCKILRRNMHLAFRLWMF